MPFTTNAGVRLYWRLEGADGRPVVLLLNSLGADLSLWDRVVPGLLPHFRILRMDSRGHGASDVPPGDYRLQVLAEDAQAVLDASSTQRAAVCGISLGGAVALTLALRAPARVGAVICACSSGQVRSADWAEGVQRVRAQGMAAEVEPAIAGFFSDDFAQAHPQIIDSMRTALRLMDPRGYAGCAAAIRDMALARQLGSVQQPVMLLSGSKDMVTPFEPHGAQLLAGLPNACHVCLEAGHLACLEAPGPFASAACEFLQSVAWSGKAAETTPAAPADPGAPDIQAQRLQTAAQTLYEAGLRIRREVLGDAWVDRALAGRTAFNSDFQEMITRSAWQEIWSRPGLDRRTRRLLVLATTIALGRWEEFRLHVRAGLAAGGFSEEELREVLMQSAVYAGVPAANTAFAHAAAVLSELQAAG
ncbi:MAG TPA: alpha/beta fold hydrolase [Steroidobacteraceae bacterium]|jgi:3-oxoadipate enol-lactonase/4-carboxymuconolactone decarboxylase